MSLYTPVLDTPPQVVFRSRWRIVYPDRSTRVTLVFPPLAHAEILERYPGAACAEPLPHAEDAALAWEAEVARQKGKRLYY